mmetsp:Transcript_22865/g.63485  ORF Transcript_22865/g.63485 Transcript_22865/m.63485 type:complete len:425 (+) Transcript_22865:68-1342(+)
MEGYMISWLRAVMNRRARMPVRGKPCCYLGDVATLALSLPVTIHALTNASLLQLLFLCFLAITAPPWGSALPAGGSRMLLKAKAGQNQVCMSGSGHWSPFSSGEAAEEGAPSRRKLSVPHRPLRLGDEMAQLEHGLGRLPNHTAPRAGSSWAWGGSEGVDQQAAAGRRRRLLAAAVQPGFNPLAKLCAAERKVKKAMDLSRGELLLSRCLKSAKSCRFSQDDREAVTKAARGLLGIQKLLQRPGCAVLNRETCPSTNGNRETAGEHVSPNHKKAYNTFSRLPPHRPAPKDLEWRACGSCAVVGNSPILKTAPDGPSIDRHDTVFRINVIGTGELSANPSAKTGPPERDPLYTGKKTTFRVFSRLVAAWLASGKVSIKPKPWESWLFWHHYARFLLPGIQKRVGRKLPLYMLGVPQINWQLSGRG